MMIRKFLLVILLAACAVPVSAQRPRTRVEWGVMGGVNVVDFSVKDNMTAVKNKLGWQFGITTAVNFGLLAIEPQILFVRQGLRINRDGFADMNLRSNSIDVPVLLSLRLLKPLRINAGPVFTVMNDCKEKSGGDMLAFGRIRPTVSYTVGLGVTILKHLLLDVRYNGQFTSKKDVMAADNWTFDLRSYNVAFSVGYIF